MIWDIELDKSLPSTPTHSQSSNVYDEGTVVIQTKLVSWSHSHPVAEISNASDTYRTHENESLPGDDSRLVNSSPRTLLPSDSASRCAQDVSATPFPPQVTVPLTSRFFDAPGVAHPANRVSFPDPHGDSGSDLNNLTPAVVQPSEQLGIPDAALGSARSDVLACEHSELAAEDIMFTMYGGHCSQETSVDILERDLQALQADDLVLDGHWDTSPSYYTFSEESCVSNLAYQMHNPHFVHEESLPNSTATRATQLTDLTSHRRQVSDDAGQYANFLEVTSDGDHVNMSFLNDEVPRSVFDFTSETQSFDSSIDEATDYSLRSADVQQHAFIDSDEFYDTATTDGLHDIMATERSVDLLPMDEDLFAQDFCVELTSYQQLSCSDEDEVIPPETDIHRFSQGRALLLGFLGSSDQTGFPNSVPVHEKTSVAEEDVIKKLHGHWLPQKL